MVAKTLKRLGSPRHTKYVQGSWRVGGRANSPLLPKLCTRRVPVGLNWERVWVGVAFASLPILG